MGIFKSYLYDGFGFIDSYSKRFYSLFRMIEDLYISFRKLTEALLKSFCPIIHCQHTEGELTLNGFSSALHSTSQHLCFSVSPNNYMEDAHGLGSVILIISTQARSLKSRHAVKTGKCILRFTSVSSSFQIHNFNQKRTNVPLSFLILPLAPLTEYVPSPPVLQGSMGSIACIAWKGDTLVLGDVDGNLNFWDLKARLSR